MEENEEREGGDKNGNCSVPLQSSCYQDVVHMVRVASIQIC